MKSEQEAASTAPETSLEFFCIMARIRAFELKIKELVQLNEVGGAAHLSIGQEAVAVGVCRATHRTDQILSTHRGHGHMIAKGADIKRMFAEILGRVTGYCQGKGGSMHIADPGLGFAGANGIVGGGITIATGIALANKSLSTDGVCVCFFGDGAAAQGGLHEALNLASLWDLPLLYVCENNQYAMSSPLAETMAAGRISEHAKPYKIQTQTIDGNNVIEVFGAACLAIEQIRTQRRPYLLECLTYRQAGHYCGDPCLYRDKDETARWMDNHDPIDALREYLTNQSIMTNKELDECLDTINQEIDSAATEALQEAQPGIDTLEEEVYVDLWAHKDIQPPSANKTAKLTYRDAANRAIDEEMARDDKVILLGEDVGVHGGAFQVTKGLFKKYGDGRILTTPISEAVIGGCTLGASLAGMRPIGEFQYSDFMTLAMDQIVNQAAKVHYMFGGRLTAPLVFRAPCGSGGRGNASQHSQSLETWFMHVPGLKVVMPATPADMVGLLKTAIRDEDPVIFLEHKALYNTIGQVPTDEYLLPFGRAEIKRSGSDVTIVATSRMVLYSLEAAEILTQEGIDVEVVDPRTLVPLDTETICSSAARTGLLVVVSEDCQRCGVASEIASIVTENVFEELESPVVRLAGKNVPIPYNRALERAAVPSVEDICQAVRSIVE